METKENVMVIFSDESNNILDYCLLYREELPKFFQDRNLNDQVLRVDKNDWWKVLSKCTIVPDGEKNPIDTPNGGYKFFLQVWDKENNKVVNPFNHCLEGLQVGNYYQIIEVSFK